MALSTTVISSALISGVNGFWSSSESSEVAANYPLAVVIAAFVNGWIIGAVSLYTYRCCSEKEKGPYQPSIFLDTIYSIGRCIVVSDKNPFRRVINRIRLTRDYNQDVNKEKRNEERNRKGCACLLAGVSIIPTALTLGMIAILTFGLPLIDVSESYVYFTVRTFAAAFFTGLVTGYTTPIISSSLNRVCKSVQERIAISPQAKNKGFKERLFRPFS